MTKKELEDRVESLEIELLHLMYALSYIIGADYVVNYAEELHKKKQKPTPPKNRIIKTNSDKL